MYNVTGKILTITRQDWLDSGLTENQLKRDAQRGLLKIHRRGRNGRSLIDFSSIERPERLERIEAYLGKIDDRFTALDKKFDKMQEQITELTRAVTMLTAQNVALLGGKGFVVSNTLDTVGKTANENTFVFPEPEHDLDARKWFCTYRKPGGNALAPELITKYANKCALFNAIDKGLEIHQNARAKAGKKVIMGEFWKLASEWYLEKSVEWNCEPLTNKKSIEKTFKSYFNGNTTDKPNYSVIINNKMGNDNARIVSKKSEKLLLAISKTINAPTKERVTNAFNDFAKGDVEFVCKETGETYKPANFRYKGKPIDISKSTAWGYLNKVPNQAATAVRRKGGFDAKAQDMPFNFMNKPQFSLSKITMDDADLSRKIKHNGKTTRLHRYAIQDVMSGYWFLPVYSREDLTAADVMECIRNMYCELEQHGLPYPGEIEHENHLVNSIKGHLEQAFPSTIFTLSSHAMNKKSEGFIRELKLVFANYNGHSRGRFWGRGIYKVPRIKVKGEFVEKGFDWRTVMEDDMRDIEQINNTLHKMQNTYPGMTRAQVFFENYNRTLTRQEQWHTLRFIGNATNTTVRNNNYVSVNHEKYLLDSFECLEKLKPNNKGVTAYWLPDLEGKVEKVYLYQNDEYIGSATTVANFRYNEAKVERTPEDEHRLHIQLGRQSSFKKMIKDINTEVPKIAIYDAKQSAEVENIVVDIIPNATKNEEVYDDDDECYETVFNAREEAYSII